MDIPIKLPVSVDREGQMTDADGKVVAHFCWLTDASHIRKQMIKAKFLERVVNQQKANEIELELVDPSGDIIIEEEPNGHATVDANQVVVNASVKTMNDFKRKGNPLFRKGFPNPYGKKKDDH